MTTKIWNGGGDNWTTSNDWGGSEPGPGDAVKITSGDPQITSNVGTIGSFYDSAQGAMNDGRLTVSGTFTLAQGGSWQVDPNGGSGGSTLTIGGKLSNAGNLSIGPSNESLGAASTITAASVSNVIGEALGQISLFGAPSVLAELDVTGAAGFGAAGTLYGAVNLYDDALLEFGKGEITTIASGSELTLSGSSARVADAGKTTSDSALTGLTKIDGQIFLQAGASVTADGSLTNLSLISVDANGGGGGSSLTVDKALTNSGSIDIGPDNDSLAKLTIVKAASLANFVGAALGTIDLFGSTTSLAELDIGAAAGFGTAGTLFGQVNLFNDARVEFTTGEISKIALSSELTLTGSGARVVNASNVHSESALTGLTTVDGGLYLNDGASVTTDQALANAGVIGLDSPGEAGGARLTVHGRLTNTGTIDIGPDNNTLTSASIIRVTSLTNSVGSSYGTINLDGDDSASAPAPVPATLDILSAAGFGAAGVLKGAVNLSFDAAIEFASGEIKTIAAQSELTLNYAGSVIADSGKTSTNSALTGLSTVEGGLYLNDGASVTTDQALANSGAIELDTPGGAGGARLTVDGKLSNSGTLVIGPNNNSLTSASMIRAASLANFAGKTFGTIDIYGDDSPQAPKPEAATLDISSAASFGSLGVLTGSVNLAYDAIVEFKSGEIKTIAANSELTLTDPGAVIADASALASNSALKGLTTNDGGLYLNDGAKITTSGPLVNAGVIGIDQPGGAGHSVLRIGGALTNASTGTLTIGPNNQSLGATSTIAANSFVNHGTVNLYGSAAFDGVLAISGGVTNDGTINVSSDAEKLAGAIGGSGAFDLYSGATLDLGSSVASGETIGFNGADTLKLGDPEKFYGHVSGFAAGDDIVASGFGSGTTMSFSEQNSVATVTLTDHANVAQLHFDGSFVRGDFHFNAGNSTLSFV